MSIATFANDDPWLRMTDAERRAHRKARREKFYNPKPDFLPPDAVAHVEIPAAPEPDPPKSTVSIVDVMLWNLLTRWQQPPEHQITINDILHAVVAHFPKVTRTDIRSERRTLDVILPRHIVCYVAKAVTTRSHGEIGRRLGGRDHTTILHAVRKINDLLPIDPEKLPEEYRDVAWIVGTVINDLGQQDV